MNQSTRIATPFIVRERFYIGGDWVSPSSAQRIEVFSASTEEQIGGVPDAGFPDVDRAVAAARRAFDDPSGWAHWAVEERADMMDRLAVAMETRGLETARLVSMQNGMPISLSSTAEAHGPADTIRYYAQLIRTTALEETREAHHGGHTLVRRGPVGVVAAIVPWNYPQNLLAVKLGPALAMGCTVVVKPSPETVLDAYVLAEAIEEAGLPAGVVNIIPGGREAGAYLVAHPDVDKVAFTGSTVAGRSIAGVCGQLLRPVTLELGGKSAAIVLDDADLGELMPRMVPQALRNNGQTCFLTTRILAPSSRYAEVVEAVSSIVAALEVGDAMVGTTQIGPVASARQRERVESYIAKGLSDGARLAVGGARPAHLDRGWFVEPTVFADVDNRTTIAQEEIFGPVLAVIRYEDVDDAIHLANDSSYGLGGSVWTADPERGEQVARRVATGTIGINGYDPDMASPMGGVKASGLGRENGPEGLAAYQVVQSMFLDR